MGHRQKEIFMSEINNMILRTVYLTPEIDSLLRTRAFRADISKNELIRKYLEAGIKADHAAAAREAQDVQAANDGLSRLFQVQHKKAASKKTASSNRLRQAATKKVAAKKVAAKKVAAKKAAAKKAVK